MDSFGTLSTGADELPPREGSIASTTASLATAFQLNDELSDTKMDAEQLLSYTKFYAIDADHACRHLGQDSVLL